MDILKARHAKIPVRQTGTVAEEGASDEDVLPLSRWFDMALQVEEKQ